MSYLQIIKIFCSGCSYIIETSFLFVKSRMIYSLIDVIGYFFIYSH